MFIIEYSATENPKLKAALYEKFRLLEKFDSLNHLKNLKYLKQCMINTPFSGVFKTLSNIYEIALCDISNGF